MGRGAQRWSNGPWKSVRNTPDAFNNAPDQLVSATNIYLEDTVHGSAAFGRLGYRLSNGGSALAGPGQCVFSNYVSIGVVDQNFVIAGGKIYRIEDDYTATDVTPAAITIGSSVAQVYMVAFNGHVVVTDGVHSPWIATDLTSTPITGTYIDIDGSGTPWNARGKPEVYGGSLVFILNSYNYVSLTTDIVWSAPGDPATGYIQNPYDFRWTLQQTEASQISALCGTNLALFYFRDYSIGALTGTPATAGSTSGSDFRNNSTQDAIAANVGCHSAATVVEYGQNIFFADAQGRPWMMPIGGQPQPIWKQMQALFDAQDAVRPGGIIERDSPYTATIDGQHGLYLVASRAANIVAGQYTPCQVAVFDAITGAYEGQWYTGSGNFIEAQGVLYRAGVQTHTMIGSITNATPVAGGYLWIQNQLNQPWGDGVYPNRVLPAISVTTPRFGFDANLVQNVDRVTAITGSAAQVKLTVTTPQDSVVVSPTPPSTSTDGTFRAVAGVQVMGRGITVKIEPQGSDLDDQWSVQQVVAQGVSSLAGPDDV